MSEIDFQNGFVCGMATKGLVRSGELYKPAIWNDEGIYNYFYIDFRRAMEDFSTGMWNESVVVHDSVQLSVLKVRHYSGYIYKVYCDIADRLRGITVMNKKTSLLRFATGERVPGFSTHMFIAGQDMMDSFGYMYESLSRAGSNKHLTLSPLSVTEADSIDLADNLSDTEVSETTTIINLFGALTATETATVTLI